MKKLFLRTQLKADTVAVPAELFDEPLSSASGEALKVYLCLLRASQDAAEVLSLEEVADRFDLTGKKLTQILVFWEELGFLRLEHTGAEVSGVELLKPGAKTPEEPYVRPVSPVPVTPDGPAACVKPAPEKPVNIHDLDTDESFTELLALAEYYLKRPLSSTLRETLGIVYLLFNRQSDVVEYLLEYCIEQGHQSPRYMETVARGWKDEGFTTLAEVRSAAQSRNRLYYSIKKAFGITNRALVREESTLAGQWVQKFDMELILEACGRTMAAIHTPSFQYADSILKAWEEKGAKSLQDVEGIDRERKAKMAKPSDTGNGSGSADRPKNSFRNFDERKTDYSELIPNYYQG